MAGLSVRAQRAQQQAEERARRLMGQTSAVVNQGVTAYTQGHSGGTTGSAMGNIAKTVGGLGALAATALGMGSKSPTGLLKGIGAVANAVTGGTSRTPGSGSGSGGPSSAQVLTQRTGPVQTGSGSPAGSQAANDQTNWAALIQQGMADGVDAATMEGWLAGRNAKIAAAGGALDQYRDDPITKAAQAYIDSKTPLAPVASSEQFDSYQDLYDRGGYADVNAQRQELLKAQLAQLENNYHGQRGSINSSAEEQARQAYIAYMQSQNTLPQQLAAAGLTGGMADSQRLALELGYQNNQREILQGRDTALNDVETALNNAKLQTTVEGVQAQGDVMRDAVSAYQNWLAQNNSFAQQSQLYTQQANQSLANQLAIMEAQQKAQQQAQQQQLEAAKLLESAQNLAAGGDYSLLGSYYGWTPEQTAYMNAWHARQVNDPKALESAQALASMGQYDALGTYYGWTPEQIAYAQNYYTTEKTMPQSQEYVLAMLGKGMMPDSALLAASNIPQSFAEAMVQAYERDQRREAAARQSQYQSPLVQSPIDAPLGPTAEDGPPVASAQQLVSEDAKQLYEEMSRFLTHAGSPGNMADPRTLYADRIANAVLTGAMYPTEAAFLSSLFGWSS